MKRRRRPRQFLYLDSPMAESYLSDWIGVLPEGTSVTGRYTNSDQKDWGIRYWGTGIGGGSGKEEFSEDQESFRYPPEAIFSRLYEELDRETEEGRILIHLDYLNRDSWQELMDGDIVEITGTIKIPQVLKAMEAAKGMEQLLPFLDEIGEWMGEDIGIGERDRSLISSLGGIREAVKSQGATVIVVELAKSPRYRFVAKLKKDHLRMPLADLEGEAKVVGTVTRKINKGDPPIGLEQLVPGFEAMRGFQDQPSPPANRAARRAGRKSSQSKDEDALSIGYPAATLTPIGIYR